MVGVLYCTVLYCTVLYCTVLYLILLRGGMPRMGSPSMVRVPFSKLRIALTQLSFVLHANIFTPQSRYFCPRTCTHAVLYCTVLYFTVLYSTSIVSSVSSSRMCASGR